MNIKNLLAMSLILISIGSFADEAGVKNSIEKNAVISCVREISSGNEKVCMGVKDIISKNAVKSCVREISSGYESYCGSIRSIPNSIK